MKNNMDDFDLELDELIAGAKAYKSMEKYSEQFHEILTCDMSFLNEKLKSFQNAVNEDMILTLMKDIDLYNSKNMIFSRIAFILNVLSQSTIQAYGKYIDEKYSEQAQKEYYNVIDTKDDPTVLNAQNISYKLVKKDTPENKKIREFAAKFDTIKTIIRDRDVSDVFIGQDVDTNNMVAQYFRLYDDPDKNLIIAFIRQIKNIKADSTTRIKKIEIFEVDSDTKEVIFWFLNKGDKFQFSKTDGVMDVYEKFSNASITARKLKYEDRNPKDKQDDLDFFKTMDNQSISTPYNYLTKELENANKHMASIQELSNDTDDKEYAKTLILPELIENLLTVDEYIDSKIEDIRAEINNIEDSIHNKKQELYKFYKNKLSK